ncbi:metallophosphoesterase family protein [Ornithinicoccus halotolerans]|uniref:metallophosphoesterase family protein n=1 Tax=Ornithinicoccus halotolerans TaxID=1748220 RepID=UPI001296FDF3|nr:metallophosphoesterase [Ornithinicoccus halotolerans]
MVRFLHTADWQLGLTRRWLRGEAQGRYADARVAAVRALGVVAGEQGCEFVVVAGDVLESPQVATGTLRRLFEALKEFPVPVYLLPGNHDPLGAGSVYRTRLWERECPGHVHVLDRPGPWPVADSVELLAAPWPSKRPGEDLVARALADLPPAEGVRIGVAHGPVDRILPDHADSNHATINTGTVEQALASGRLHYLALGDRHSVTPVGDSGAIWYSGTPEVTDFRERRPGEVLVVDVDPGAPEPVRVAGHQVGRWRFEVVERELLDGRDVETLDADLDRRVDKDRAVVRLVLRGVLDLPAHQRLGEVLERHGQLFAALHTWDRAGDLRLRPDLTAMPGWGLSGFVAGAAAEIADSSAGAGQLQPPGTTDRADGAQSSAALLDWEPSWDGPEDATSARDALALLYRLTVAREST